MSSDLQHHPPVLPEPELEGDLDLSRWIDALRRRWRLVAVTLGLALAAAILLYVITPREYRATTLVQIDPPNNAVLSIEELLGVTGARDTAFYATQERLLRSRGLAERVVRNLRLAEDPAFSPARAALVGDGGTVADAAADEREIAGLANRLLAGLSVNPIRETRLVEIAYRSASPELAARVANGVAETYIDWGIESRSETVGRAVSFLADQIETLKREIADKEAQLQAYSRSSDIVALDPGSNVVLQRLEGLNQDYTAAVSARIDKEARYHEVARAPKEKTADEYSGGMITQLRRELIGLEQEYATKLDTYKPEWPAMQELRAKIDRSRQHLQSVVDEMVEKARESAHAEYQTALRREQALTAELGRQKGEAMNLNSAAVEYNNLKVEVSTRRALLDELVRKQSETGVANRLQGTRSTNVTVVDRALVPGGPFRPSLERNLMMGAMIGLLLGIGAVLGLEVVDRRLRAPEDVERILGLPVLGAIPDTGETKGRAYGYALKRRRGDDSAGSDGEPRQPELIPHTQPRLAVSEAYRTLRTALMLSTAGGLQAVVVTSPGPGDGKTTTATNLAVVLAQLGREVLLVDGDLRKPRLHRILGVSNRRGLVNHLTTGVDPAQVMQRSALANLYITPAGPIPPNPSELLSSEAMRDFMDLARKRFEFIVVDSPPAVAVTDATILGTLADGVILCINSGHTTRDAALVAAERLAVGDVRILGVVINRMRPETTYGSAYSYSGYAYATYGEDTAESGPSLRVVEP